MATLDFARTVRQEGLLILSKAAGSQGSCPPPRTESPPPLPSHLSSNHQDYAGSKLLTPPEPELTEHLF